MTDQPTVTIMPDGTMKYRGVNIGKRTSVRAALRHPQSGGASPTARPARPASTQGRQRDADDYPISADRATVPSVHGNWASAPPDAAGEWYPSNWLPEIIRGERLA